MACSEGDCDRWRGRVDERLTRVEEKLDEFIVEMRTWRHSTNNTIQKMMLAEERREGRKEGSKAVLVMIGSIIGAGMTALAAWLGKRI